MLLWKTHKKKKDKYKTRLGGVVVPWEPCKRWKFDHTTKWYKYKPAQSILDNGMHKILRDFVIQNQLILANNQSPFLINKKKRVCLPVAFAAPVGQRVKIKENEKIDKYLVRELKKLGHEGDSDTNSLETVSKGLEEWREELKTRGRIGTIQITELLRSAKIFRRVLETWWHLVSFIPQWKTTS